MVPASCVSKARQCVAILLSIVATCANVMAQETSQPERVTGRDASSHDPEAYLYLYRIGLAQREWSANNLARAEEILQLCSEQQRRNWEWRYLRRLCHSELLHFKGHPGGSWAVAFSRDGKRIASSGFRHVKVWDANSGKVSVSFEDHQGWVSAVVFSPDGARIASAGFKDVVVWETSTGKELLRIPAHDLLIKGLDFSPDGSKLVSSSGGVGKIKVWNALTGEQLLKISEPYWVNCVRFSPDGGWIASASGNLSVLGPARPGSLKVWDAETGKMVFDFPGHEFWITSVAFDPKGRYLASASADKTVKLWDLKAGTERSTLRGHRRWVRAVLFTPDGSRIASAGDDQVVHLWSVESGRRLSTLRGPVGRIQGLAVNPEGSRLVTTTRRVKREVSQFAGAVQVWRIAGDQTSTVFTDHDSGATSVALSRDGMYVASASSSLTSGKPGKVVVRNVATGKVIHAFHGKGLGFSNVAFTSDSQVVVALGGEGIQQWSVATGQPLRSIPIRVHPTNGLAVSPDGKLLAAGGTTVWDASTGKVLFKTAGHTIPSHVTALTFSPDGKRLASANWGGNLSKTVDGQRKTIKAESEVKIWDARTGGELLTLRGGGRGAAFSPDGRLLASGDDEGVITLFNTENGSIVATMRGHAKAVTGVAFNTDGKRVVSSGQDETLRVWDVETGLEALALRGHAGSVVDVAVDPVRHRIASAGDDGKVRLWNATSVR